MYKFTWLFIFVLFSTSLLARVDEALIKKESQSNQWIRLMHYKKTLFGYKSDADAQTFFVSENGKYDPLEELRANIEIFHKDIKVGLGGFHPQCAYPARFKYIKKTFNVNYKEVDCKDLKWWLDRLSPKSISVIYSSAYPNNPASIYGHTFLKLNKKSNNKEIKDFAVDFAAITDTDSGFIFAFKGLLGGYKGQYAIKPYYVKVKEYIDKESRDLWEYELNYTQEEIDFILLHLWELGQTNYFDYYFFDENCSYQLLTLLEVARPDKDLSVLEYFYTLPPATVKHLNKLGFIKSTKVRPSLRKKVLWEKSQLTKLQSKTFDSLYDGEIEVASVQDVKVIDSLITLLSFKKNEFKIKDVEKKLMRKLLIKRSKINETNKFDHSALKKEMIEEDVLLSHGSNRLSVSYGYNEEEKSFGEFEFRLGLHGLSDYGKGYPKSSHFEYAKFNLRYLTDFQKFKLDKYDFIKIISLFPIVPKDFDKSWTIQLRGERPKDLPLSSSLSHIFTSNFGVSIGSSDLSKILYFLPGLHLEFKGGLPKDFRYGPNVKLGTVLRFGEKMNLHLELQSLYDLNSNFKEKWSHKLESVITYSFSQNFQIRPEFGLYSQTLDRNEHRYDSKISFDLFY